MSLSTIDEVRARFKTLQENVEGVKKAFGHIPRSIESIELPAFITRVGNAEYDYSRIGEQIVVEDRVYNMQLYVREALTGGDESVAEESAIAFIDPVRNFFVKRPGLEIEPGDGSEIVYQARLEGDVMVIGVPFPSSGKRTYAAVQFDIRVRVLHQIQYI